jgi:hypothetical protein
MRTSVFLFHLLELTAAISASIYWLKTKDKSIKPFVWYLWFIVCVETIGLYPYLYDITDNSIIKAIANSRIRRNFWLYNLYNPIVVLLIGMFLIANTKDLISHKVITLVSWSYVFFCIGYFLITNSFFKHELPYDWIVSTFVIFTMVMLYLRELMRSDKILRFYKTPVFYVTTALLLWYICLTPIVIFNSYFLKINPEFNAFRRTFLATSNIILYSWYTLAFLYPLRYKKKSAQK